jgi:hypothetical protein
LVSSYAIEDGGRLLLFDPLATPEEIVERARAREAAIVLTSPWLLEAVATEEPLVAVFDDIQWGEDVFLDLLEHVAFLSTGAPLLLSSGECRRISRSPLPVSPLLSYDRSSLERRARGT